MTTLRERVRMHTQTPDDLPEYSHKEALLVGPLSFLMMVPPATVVGVVGGTVVGGLWGVSPALAGIVAALLAYGWWTALDVLFDYALFPIAEHAVGIPREVSES